MRIAAVFLAASLAGCAHKAIIQTYRLAGTGAHTVLVPPQVAAGVVQRTFNADIAAGRGKCPSAPGSIPVERKRKRIRVTVSQGTLAKQPAGWLNEWTADLETQGCIAAGTGPKLAQQIAEAIPLETNQAFHLLHSNQLDVTPQMTIQVVSPILREGAVTGDSTIKSVEATGSGITVSVKSSENLIGYEMASYSVRPKPNEVGLKIVPVYADRHIGDETERRPEPATNYFRFPADAAFYRVFYEAEQTEYAALIVGARTQAELERRTRLLSTGAASCDKLNQELCVTVPKQVAVNGFVSVTVNGNQTLVHWGTTIGGVVRAAGEREPVLPKLTVSRLYRGKPVAVEFDRASPAILNLIVTGGEVVGWK